MNNLTAKQKRTLRFMSKGYVLVGFPLSGRAYLRLAEQGKKTKLELSDWPTAFTLHKLGYIEGRVIDAARQEFQINEEGRKWVQSNV